MKHSDTHKTKENICNFCGKIFKKPSDLVSIVYVVKPLGYCKYFNFSRLGILGHTLAKNLTNAINATNLSP